MDRFIFVYRDCYFFPTYYGIIGLLFRKTAILIVVFSIETILKAIIIILFLSMRNIYRNNNLLQKQINFGADNKNMKENLINKNKDETKRIDGVSDGV